MRSVRHTKDATFMFMFLPILAIYECYFHTGKLPTEGIFNSGQDAWLYDEECLQKYFVQLFNGEKFKVDLFGFIEKYKV